MSEMYVALKNAMWLGWQNESNWTNKWFYFAYAAIRPMAQCLILFFIYRLVTANPANDERFVAIYVAQAFFTIFIAVSGGISWVVIQDREHFRIIRYIYIAPMPFWLYILGRAMVVLLVACVSLAILLLFGWLVLGLPIGPEHVHPGLLAYATLLGIAGAGCVGLAFAGFCLVTARHSMMMAEGAGAVFLIFCGVIYPIDLLPGLLRAVGLPLPMTYWMELVRRAFDAQGFSPLLERLTTPSIVGLLTFLTVGFAAFSLYIFNVCENAAKRAGTLDQTTNY
ncbi:ABC transporter permease [bacterium]|nr:ABC transporter permease [bacterium]